jgi:hypothetical protein
LTASGITGPPSGVLLEKGEVMLIREHRVRVFPAPVVVAVEAFLRSWEAFLRSWPTVAARLDSGLCWLRLLADALIERALEAVRARGFRETSLYYLASGFFSVVVGWLLVHAGS